MEDGVCEDGTRRRAPMDAAGAGEGIATALRTFLAGCGLTVRLVVKASSDEEFSGGFMISSESLSLTSSLTSIDLRGRPRLGAAGFFSYVEA